MWLERFKPQGHKLPGVQVILDHRHRHMAPSKASAQECVLGAQISKAPYLRRRVYRQEYVVFLTTQDGRIVQLREYFDPIQAALALDAPVVGVSSRSI